MISGRLFMATLLFPAILAVQILATLTEKNIYPFSPYRMFSKNWKDGIVMDRVIFRYSKNEKRPWDLLHVPFFQANNATYVTFLDESTEAQRNALCHLLLDAATTDTLDVISEPIQFKRDPRKQIATTVVESRTSYVCRKNI